jgi:hypothetical protein
MSLNNIKYQAASRTESSDDEHMKVQISADCTAKGKLEKCAQYFGQNTLREEIILEIWA